MYCVAFRESGRAYFGMTFGNIRSKTSYWLNHSFLGNFLLRILAAKLRVILNLKQGYFNSQGTHNRSSRLTVESLLQECE